METGWTLTTACLQCIYISRCQMTRSYWLQKYWVRRQERRCAGSHSQLLYMTGGWRRRKIHLPLLTFNVFCCSYLRWGGEGSCLFGFCYMAAALRFIEPDLLHDSPFSTPERTRPQHLSHWDQIPDSEEEAQSSLPTPPKDISAALVAKVAQKNSLPIKIFLFH